MEQTDPDPDSIGLAVRDWESGSRQAKISLQKRNKVKKIMFYESERPFYFLGV
jgi:hypothetical protein